MRLRHRLVVRQEVRVADPAVAVRVLLLVPGEVSRDPAGDGVSDELFRRHENGEDDEQHCRLQVVETVDDVTVALRLIPGQLVQADGPQDRFHGDRLDVLCTVSDWSTRFRR